MKHFLFCLALTINVVVFAQPSTPLYTPDETKRILQLLDSTHTELIGITNSLSDIQFFHHIDTTTWSANDILEHLGLIDEGYVREMWFTLSQPTLPSSYADSTIGGDEQAIAYATQTEKGKARGTNLPRNRYCTKATCVRIFSEANNLAKEFFIVNANKDLRKYFIFRLDSKGVRTFRDIHQLGLLMVAHRIRHINQLKAIIAGSKFPE